MKQFQERKSIDTKWFKLKTYLLDHVSHLHLSIYFQIYFHSLFNRFDFFVVISSILELVLTSTKIMPPIGNFQFMRPLYTKRYVGKLMHLLLTLTMIFSRYVSIEMHPASKGFQGHKVSTLLTVILANNIIFRRVM